RARIPDRPGQPVRRQHLADGGVRGHGALRPAPQAEIARRRLTAAGMSRIAYVNGRYVAHRDASVHIEDRGYQFADGGYEVCEVKGSRLIDERRHMQRLQRSLAELRIRLPMSEASFGVVLREVVRRNRVKDGLVYLQVTRGVAPRNHAFPVVDV